MNSLVDNFIAKFSFAPKYFSRDFRKKLARDLFQARSSYSEEDYLSLCFGLSLTCSLFSLALLSVSLDYAPFSVVVFVVCFFALVKHPEIRKKRRAKGIEKELPDALRLIGIELNMNLPFETAVKSACSDSGLGKELRQVLRMIENGASPQEAFRSFSDRTDSNFAKRACAQLIEAYERGGSGGTLKKLAEEQESIIRARLKEYNGKMIVYSLLFIAASAVFPAIFQAFVIVGSSFLSFSISPVQALLIPVLFFPFVNLAIFAVVRWRSP